MQNFLIYVVYWLHCNRHESRSAGDSNHFFPGFTLPSRRNCADLNLVPASREDLYDDMTRCSSSLLTFRDSKFLCQGPGVKVTGGKAKVKVKRKSGQGTYLSPRNPHLKQQPLTYQAYHQHGQSRAELPSVSAIAEWKFLTPRGWEVSKLACTYTVLSPLFCTYGHLRGGATAQDAEVRQNTFMAAARSAGGKISAAPRNTLDIFWQFPLILPDSNCSAWCTASLVCLTDRRLHSGGILISELQYTQYI